MKKTILFSAYILCVMFIFSACKKNDVPSKKENCRVLSTSVTSTSAGGANYITNYKYDAKGYISSESTDLGGLLEIKFTRDDKGKLISSDSYYMGDFVSKEKFNYTNGRISKVEIFDPSNNPIGVHNIKYNSAGDIIEFTNEYGDPAYDNKNLFEYNADRVQTKYTTADLSGKVKSYVITKPVGAPGKASEIYLIDHGLPYQMIFNYAYSVAEPGVGSTVEVYFPNASGNIVLQETLKMKAISTNSRGFTREVVLANSAGETVQTVKYQFENCN